MENNQEILDDYSLIEKLEESRFVTVVRSVVGVLFTLFGVLFILGVGYDLYRFIQLINSPFSFNFISWGDWFLNKSLSFVYTAVFLLGGIGLLRKSNTGWAFSITVSMFVILQIGFMVYWISSTIPASVGGLGSYGWILLGVVLFFVVIFFLLLSKAIRSYFQPTPRTFWVAGITFVVLATCFTVNIVFLG